MSSRQLTPAFGNSRAVVMGTWRYNERELGPNLPPVENSWRRFADMLSSPLCGWPEDSINRIANEPDPGRIPNLLMTEFAAATDVALFYYVGHGFLSADFDADLCLALTGTVSKDPNQRITTSLSYGAVRRALLKSKAATKIVILDCCHSGQATGPRHSLSGTSATMAGTELAEFMDEADVEGSYVLVAASRNKKAYYETASATGSPQTYFTKYLVDLVERGIMDETRDISMETLFTRLGADLRAGGHQRPLRRNVDSGGTYVFCHNAALIPAPPPPTVLRPRYEAPAQGRGRTSLPTRPHRGVLLGVSGVAVVAVAAGITMLEIPHGSPPSSPLSYSFTPAQHDHGLTIDRRWNLGGAGDTSFTESLTVTNPTDAAVRASFEESVPAPLRAVMARARFTPTAPKIADAGATLDWTIQVPTHGSASYGYEVTLASAGTTQTELAQWATALAMPSPSPSAAHSAGLAGLRSLSILPAKPHLDAGHSIQLTLNGLLADGQRAQATILKSATWESSDHSVVTVTSDGKITAVAPGIARVTVRLGTVTASVSVTALASSVDVPTPTPGYTYQQPIPTPQQSTPATTPATTPSSSHPVTTAPVVTITPSTL